METKSICIELNTPLYSASSMRSEILTNVFTRKSQTIRRQILRKIPDTQTSLASIHKRIPTRLTLTDFVFASSYQRTHLLSFLEVYRLPAALGQSYLHLEVA